MTILGLAVLFAASSAAPANLSPLVDSDVVDYYSRALSAEREGDSQKSMAMLKALLVPRAAVRVDYSGLPDDIRASFKRGVESGFAMWRTSLGSDMPFTLTDRADAPVTLRFVDAIHGHNHQGMACKGEITAKRRIQWGPNVHYFEFTAQVSIVRYRQGKEWMTSDEVAHITAHELGHALGLGDIQRSGRLMGPMVMGKPLASVPPDESRAVAQLRSVLKYEIDRVATQSSTRPVSGNQRTAIAIP